MIVHLVTDRRRLSGAVPLDHARRCLLRQAQYAIDAGIDCIQIRERDLEARELADLATAVVALTRRTLTRVIVNDRIDVALACGADGVHLRGDSIPAIAARRLVPPGFLIGCSVHNVTQAIAASGADYLIAGTVWPTISKPDHHPLLGLEGFAAIVTAVSVPVLAIGGVTAERVTAVARAGGAGVAAIGLFSDEPMGDDCRAVPLTEMLSTIRQRFDSSRTR